MIHATAFIHPTAIVEEEVRIGPNTRIWDGVHVRKGAEIGRDCIVGEKTYIGPKVKIGNYVKINAMVYIPTAVTIEDFVMISAGAVFTNDKYPRAFRPDLSGLAPSEPTEDTLPTVIRKGVTVGANATTGCGISLGEFSMVGMGSVVTKDVPSHALVFGNPAVFRGLVCTCGQFLITSDRSNLSEIFTRRLTCSRCAREFELSERGVVREIA
ncbi:MAG: acyltransferase [Nitrospinota bacterium]